MGHHRRVGGRDPAGRRGASRMGCQEDLGCTEAGRCAGFLLDPAFRFRREADPAFLILDQGRRSGFVPGIEESRFGGHRVAQDAQGFYAVRGVVADRDFHRPSLPRVPVEPCGRRIGRDLRRGVGARGPDPSSESPSASLRAPVIISGSSPVLVNVNSHFPSLLRGWLQPMLP